MKERAFDVGIIGGGPGGSTLGALLAKQGLDVAIFERETFPRFHIGESLLPATMHLFKKSGFHDTLASGKYLPKYGARFVDYRSTDEIRFGFQDSLIPEFPNAYEVERSELDRDLLEHARKLGVTVFQPEAVEDIVPDSNAVRIRTGARELRASFVADASGRDAFLGKRQGIRKVNRDLNNVAVFSHYEGVRRNPGKDEGDIVIGLLPENSWTWIIPFQGARTSVGVVCSSEVFRSEKNLEVYLDRRLLEERSNVRDYLSGARKVTETRVISNYSHTSDAFFGERWILVGDAAAFLDPIFSSGVHVSTTSAELACDALVVALRDRKSLSEDRIGERYEAELRKGINRFRNLIGMFYNGTGFVAQMKKTLTLKEARRAFTSAVAGDVWNDGNFLFQKGIL